MKQIAVNIIKIYRKFISGNVLCTCRYHPSCSEYAIDAIGKYGFFSGSMKSAWRILRCNPLSRGGYDPA